MSRATPAFYHSPAILLSCRQKDPAARFEADGSVKVDLSSAQAKTLQSSRWLGMRWQPDISWDGLPFLKQRRGACERSQGRHLRVQQEHRSRGGAPGIGSAHKQKE